MLFKELLNVLVMGKCYNIRIDVLDSDKGKAEKNIYKITDIPLHYDNYKVELIHTSDIYNSDIYQYFVTISKGN